MTDLQKILHAQHASGVYHVFPVKEAEIHQVGEKVISKLSYVLHGNALCFCDPKVEDYRREGGGLLIIHQQHTWH